MNGLFATPEQIQAQALEKLRQERLAGLARSGQAYAQAPDLAGRLAALGSTVGQAAGGMFAKPNVDQAEMDLAQKRQNILKGLSGSPSSSDFYFEGAKQLFKEGDATGAVEMLKYGTALKETEAKGTTKPNITTNTIVKDGVETIEQTAVDPVSGEILWTRTVGTKEKLGKEDFVKAEKGDKILWFKRNQDGTLSKTPLYESDKFSPDAKGLTGAGQTAFQRELGKKRAASLVESHDKAKTAYKAIQTASNAKTQLEGGIYSGKFANFMVGLERTLEGIGFSAGDKASRTEAFMANQGNAVLSILGSGALGAGTGISDNDRLFAKQIAGGEITLTENAIKRIIDLNEKVNRNVIDFHNKDFLKDKTKTTFDLTLEAPDYKPFFAYPKSKEEADALPKGTEFIGPDGNIRVR